MSNPCFDPCKLTTPRRATGHLLYYRAQVRQIILRLGGDPTVLLHVTGGANRTVVSDHGSTAWDKGFPAKLGITNILAEAEFPYIYSPPFTPLGANGSGKGGGPSPATGRKPVLGSREAHFQVRRANTVDGLTGGEGPGTSRAILVQPKWDRASLQRWQPRAAVLPACFSDGWTTP